MSNTKINQDVPDLKSKNFWNVKRIAIIAVFIALSAVGSMIKIPSPIGTIGFDSAPGYFVALAFGGLEGAIVISIGSVLSAAMVGFPLGIPIRILIAITMALWALLFRWVSNKFGIVLGIIAATFGNGVLSCFILILVGGWGMFVGTLPFLVVASGINIIISAVAYKAVKSSKLI